MSEPETWALVNYITARTNIAAIHTYHTSGGLILRFPTLADQDWNFPAADLEDYRQIAVDGAVHTEYANYAYDKQAIVDLMSPGHGVFNDWASKVFGVYAITTEMWRNGFSEGPAARFDWNDRVLGGSGFIDWQPLDNETLRRTVLDLMAPFPARRGDTGAASTGERVIEIGGWDRFSVSNPPERLIAAELSRNTAWVLTFADKLPRVAIIDATVIPVAGAAALFAIQATVANVGWMPTATAHAVETLRTAQPVVVEITLHNAALPSDVPGRSPAGLTFSSQSLGFLAGARADQPAKMNQMFWNAEIIDPAQPASIEIVVRSQKAGVARRRIEFSAEEGH